MKIFTKFILSIIAFLSGILFFLIYNDILVIKFISFNKNNFVGNFFDHSTVKKNVTFYYWKDEKFNTEKRDLIWLSDKAETLKHFVNDWLKILLEENIIKKRVILNSIALSKEKDIAYLSFDQSFLEQSWSIYAKWNCIESLLKSIKDADFKIKEIVFLVNNNAMHDEHLDFSQSWGILGFYQ